MLCIPPCRVVLESLIRQERPFGEIVRKSLQVLHQDQVRKRHIGIGSGGTERGERDIVLPAVSKISIRGVWPCNKKMELFQHFSPTDDVSKATPSRYS